MNIMVVTPTQGTRTVTLNKMIEAVAGMLLPGDVHLVLYDAPEDAPNLDCKSSPFLMINRVQVPGSVYGNGQRDYAAIISPNFADCIVYMDDDDCPGPDAFAVLHATPADRETVHFFRMRSEEKLYPPDKPFVCQMGGPQCVPPARADLPLWMARNEYQADGHFIEACHERFKPVYHEEIICYVRGL